MFFLDIKKRLAIKPIKYIPVIKNLIISTYLDITTNICEANNNLCTQAKEDFQSLKKSFGFTWDFIKSLASQGLDKLKNWYEIWSGK